MNSVCNYRIPVNLSESSFKSFLDELGVSLCNIVLFRLIALRSCVFFAFSPFSWKFLEVGNCLRCVEYNSCKLTHVYLENHWSICSKILCFFGFVQILFKTTCAITLITRARFKQEIVKIKVKFCGHSGKLSIIKYDKINVKYTAIIKTPVKPNEFLTVFRRKTLPDRNALYLFLIEDDEDKIMIKFWC